MREPLDHSSMTYGYTYDKQRFVLFHVDNLKLWLQ